MLSQFVCLCLLMSETKFMSASLWFQAIGAEYGEGFETFRMDGPLKVDVVWILICLFRHVVVKYIDPSLQEL